MQVTCRCGSQVEIPATGGSAGRSCPFCGIPIRLALTLPIEGGDGLLLRCFCTHELHLPGSARGTTITCTECQRMILVPSIDGVVLELGDTETGVTELTMLCALCGCHLPEGEEGLCQRCQESPQPEHGTRRRRPAIVRPAVRETPSPVARVILILVVVLAVGGLAFHLLRGTTWSRSGVEDLAPATQDEVTRRLTAYTPLILEQTRKAAVVEATGHLEAVTLLDLVMVENGAGVATCIQHLEGQEEGQPVTGYVQLTPRLLPGTLDTRQRPPLVLLDLLICLTLTTRDGSPLEPVEPLRPDGPPGACLTCAYHPERGCITLESWDPPLAGVTVPPGSSTSLVTSRTPSVREVCEIAARDLLMVLRLLEPLLLQELAASRPGNEVLLISHESIPGGGRDLTLRLLGPHPRHGEEPLLWRLHLLPEILVDELDRTTRDPIVPVRLTLEEELPTVDEARAVPSGGTTTIRCQVDRVEGALYLPPQAERSLAEHRIFPDWR